MRLVLCLAIALFVDVDVSLRIGKFMSSVYICVYAKALCAEESRARKQKKTRVSRYRRRRYCCLPAVALRRYIHQRVFYRKGARDTEMTTTI